MADGAEHEVKIVYYPFINYNYVEYFTAIENAIPYMMDNEENRRMGTLVLWLDSLPKNYTDFSAKPLLAMPINLSVLLKLRDGTAYAGFTASTGRQFQKHDVISWTFVRIIKHVAMTYRLLRTHHGILIIIRRIYFIQAPSMAKPSLGMRGVRQIKVV